jgi:hypothetical protein
VIEKMRHVPAQKKLRCTPCYGRLALASCVRRGYKSAADISYPKDTQPQGDFMRILIQLIQLVVIVGFFIMLYKWNKTRPLMAFKKYHAQKRGEYPWLENWIQKNGDPSEEMAEGASYTAVGAGVLVFLVLMIITYFIGEIGKVGIVPTLVYLAIAAGVCFLYTRKRAKNPGDYEGAELGLTLECPSCHCPHSWVMTQKEEIVEGKETSQSVTTTTYKGAGTDWGFGAGDLTHTKVGKASHTYYGRSIKDFKCLNCGHTEQNEYAERWPMYTSDNEKESGVYTFDPPKPAWGYEEILEKQKDAANDLYEQSKKEEAQQTSAPSTTAAQSSDNAGIPEALLKAAELGNEEAQFDVGVRYLFGKGVEQDDEKAIMWLGEKYRADNGKFDCHEFGQQVYFDEKYDIAVPVLTRAIEVDTDTFKSDAFMSCYYLGECYQNGNGIPVNIEKARYFYQKSADLGWDDAKKALKKLK